MEPTRVCIQWREGGATCDGKFVCGGVLSEKEERDSGMKYYQIDLAICMDPAMTEAGHDDWVNSMQMDRTDWISKVQDGEMTIGEVAAAISAAAAAAFEE